MHTPKPDMGSEDKAPQRTERRMHILLTIHLGIFLRVWETQSSLTAFVVQPWKQQRFFFTEIQTRLLKKKNTDRLVSSFMKNPNV